MKNQWPDWVEGRLGVEVSTAPCRPAAPGGPTSGLHASRADTEDTACGPPTLFGSRLMQRHAYALEARGIFRRPMPARLPCRSRRIPGARTSPREVSHSKARAGQAARRRQKEIVMRHQRGQPMMVASVSGSCAAGNAPGSTHHQRSADAPPMGVLLVTPQRCIGGHGSAMGKMRVGVGTAERIQAGQLLRQHLGPQVAQAVGVHQAWRTGTCKEV